jgi:hypothetical protein
MLIGQISDRIVVRENFNEKGAFLNKQTFVANKVIYNDGYYEIEVITELFDRDKNPTDKYTTIYRCKPDEASIIVMTLPFSTRKSKPTEIQTMSKNFKKLYDLENLKDIKLEMSFDSGILKFFGSQTIIKIYDRALDDNKKTIKSKINMKAYAWGIRIKQINYIVNEKLNEKGLLTSQKFTKADGSYFIINYI